ncbi:MAG: pyruvate kinase [Syntrophorhabdaceae bacterium]|nr:pyruvate kinase [Syntrophorhabdaceae bacterium]
MRKAKIVCTIGPATSDESMLKSLIENGMDVARLNFSHGDYETHGRIIDRIRKISEEIGRDVAILQDLQGVKIRIGPVRDEGVFLKEGETTKIYPRDGISDRDGIYIDHPSLVDEVEEGDTVLIDDGLIRLTIEKKENGYLSAVIKEGGLLKSKKGVNLPGVNVKFGSFTEKDKRDLAFGLEKGVDFIALSFVRKKEDIETVLKWLDERDAHIPVIAKIEKQEAIEDIEGILDVADGIMIARGDLGIEIPLEEVPMYQKMLIEKANRAGKVVITATQMLESMTVHSRPTRAETTDVANAVIDGTDALMLSGETSSGAYPIESLKVMDRIIRYTEGETLKREIIHSPSIIHGGLFETPKAVAHAASHAAEEVGAKWIVVFTKSGFTARLVSKFRPKIPIIAFSPDVKVVREMRILWGVTPFITHRINDMEGLLNEVERGLIGTGKVTKGDRVVIVASLPFSFASKTNLLKIHEI